MKKAIFTLAVLVMAFGNVGLAQNRINLKSVAKATMLKQYGVRERNDMVPQTANWRDTYGDKYRVTYEYDENEFYLNTEIYEVFWDEVWQEYEMISYEYDFDGNVLVELVQDFDGEEWIDMTQATFSYENGLISEVIIQYWEDGEWVNVEKAVYTYTDDDNWTILYWDWNGSTWSSNELYTFNKSAESIELLIQYMQGGAWQNDAKETYTLNFDGIVTEILTEDWQNNTWVNERKVSYDFDFGSSVYGVREVFDWENGAWVQNHRSSYSYQDGNADHAYCVKLENGAFVVVDGDLEMSYWYCANSIMFYGCEIDMTYIDVTALKEAAQIVSFVVYPVPAENEIQIQAEGFQKAEIFTITGQMLLESEQNSVNVSGLAAGVYLLKVYDQTGSSATQKLVVK